jgi:aspartate kinase
LVVQKFGGTSVATAERLKAAARRSIRTKLDGHQVVVVVSARGDTTDDLIDMAKEVTESPPSREMDMLLSTGEQISIALMAMAIQSLGHPAISFTGVQVGIATDSTHTKARIRGISTQRVQRALDAGQIVIVAGFQGVDEGGEITTLGRGGSDTTAVALATVLKHDPSRSKTEVDCEIYTDVDGVYTTDPRIVPEAQKILAISYDEMLEMASLGAGVMHSRSIEFAKKFHVPIMVRSSFSDVEGTWIVPEAEWMQQTPVCGVAIAKDEARVNIAGVPDQPGVSHRIFSAIAEKNIVVDMIVQNVGQAGRAEIGFTVPRGDLQATLGVVNALAKELGATVQFEENASKVSVVGVGMRTHTGVAEKMFQALAAEQVNIRMITTSDIKISVLVDRADGQKALRAVHQAFGLHEPRPQPEKVAANGRRGNGGGGDEREIMASLSAMEEIVVSDVVLDAAQGRITIFDVPDQPGQCARIFSAVARAGVVVDMIVQNTNAAGLGELSLSVPRGDVSKALEATRQALQQMGATARVTAEPNIAKVSVLGVGMRTHTGVARKMFGALAQASINISMITTSEIKIGVVVDLPNGEAAAAALKQAFGVR